MKEVADIGVIGMSTMGSNLALNIEGKGYKVSVFNRTPSKTERFIKDKATGKRIYPFYSLEEFANSLKSPKVILLMIKAGKPVDDYIEKLIPFLSKDDIIIDGGNSHFLDTKRRCEWLSRKGMDFLGIGISGGEKGALYGPSIMAGGSRKAYDKVSDILLSIAAETDDGKCCAYFGKDGAGHFVKMVHNGIEYAFMQLIAESYMLMRTLLNMNVEEIGKVFSNWNNGRLNSFLMEISAKIMSKKDKITGRPMIDVILDRAGSKGTGKWTVQTALDLGVPVPVISAAVESRILSSYKDERVKLATMSGKNKYSSDIDVDIFLQKLEEALYTSVVAAYIQGLHMIAVASREFGYQTKLSEVVRVWEGGCIIRSKLLKLLRKIYLGNPGVENIMLVRQIFDILNAGTKSLVDVISEAIRAELPTMTMSDTLGYINSMKSEYLPANLIQAQRDFFGAHTFQRIDREGVFHEEWEQD